MSEVEKKKITREGLRNAFKIYKYLKPFRREYYIGIFFLLGSSLASLAFPKLLGELVNSGNKEASAHSLNQIALLLGVILLVQSVFSYFRIVLFVNVTEKTLAFLRQDTYNHLIKLPLRFFDQRRVGELNSRISSDIILLQETTPQHWLSLSGRSSSSSEALLYWLSPRCSSPFLCWPFCLGS